jgi:hypothetical protein
MTTVTIAVRFSVADVDVGTTAAKRAKEMWAKAGASAYRVTQIFTGPNFGQWLFELDFEDFAHFQKCREKVLKSGEMASIQADNAKAGNKMEGREMLLTLDI